MKVVILLTVLLSGCVDSDMWDLAESACSANDGIDIVWHDGDVRCNNGAVFTNDRLAKQQ